MVAADLHMHSTASDGQYSPGELVKMGKEKGLEVLALTDHDTFSGVQEAIAAGERLGVRVLRGVELSAREYPSLHILGYGFSAGAPSIQALCKKMQAARDERKYRIAAFLREKGVDIDLREVEDLAGGAVPWRAARRLAATRTSCMRPWWRSSSRTTPRSSTRPCRTGIRAIGRGAEASTTS